MERSQFIKEIEAYAQQMAIRLPKTKEGGIIILAVDDKEVIKCLICRPDDRKKMLIDLLNDNEVKRTLIDIYNDRD